ncbi:poly(A) polymerase large subunit [Cetacean poxvirus 1]|nr:poly(A) polymerase large subunit [Cetacean poxvirus 1]
MMMNNNAKYILEKYLGRSITTSEYYMLKNQLYNINKILNFNKDIFISLLRKNKKRFFSNIDTNYVDIKNRVINYFSKQHNVYVIGHLLSIIEFQTIIVTTYTHVLGVLTIKSPNIYVSQQSLNVSSMERIAMDILKSINVVKNEDRKLMGRHNVSSLVNDVNKLMEEYLRVHNRTCICYGSYSLYLINPKITYGDIDILQTNSRTFLINLAFLIYFITNDNVILLKVPYLKNYIVMRDKNENHILDSFNIRYDTMNSIPKVLIQNMYIVDPVFQLMSMLKMFSQIDRLEDLSEKIDKFVIRLATMLEYVKNDQKITINGESHSMPLHMTIDESSRTLKVNTSSYQFGYTSCIIFLDEMDLSKHILDLCIDDNVVDFENVSNSVYAIHNDIMYTYFSNTILMSSDNEIHIITRRAICAHILMHQILVKQNYLEPLSDLINSLLVYDKIPIHKVIPRDKKHGNHRIIDIENNIITH